jgi:hypothetical protein
LANVSIAEMVSAIRTAGEDGYLGPGSLALPPAAEDLVRRVERALVASLENTSIKALVAEGFDAAPRGGSNDSADDPPDRVSGALRTIDSSGKAV